MPLTWQAERFPATGGINGQGVLRQLGRPAMDWAELLIRESVQNSWDARLNSDIPVRFRIIGYELTDSQKRVLCASVFPEGPSKYAPAKVRRVLLLQDSNTWGLSGPLRADRALGTDSVPPNFVRFLRNIGQTHSGELRATGGTYGFGKASYYLASRCNTIIVHSRCANQQSGAPESRFIAAQLGEPYAFDDTQYTGRHWWGVYDPEIPIVDPVLHAAADSLAQSLGIPVPTGQETGTSILILDPIFTEARPELDMAKIAKAVAASFWPKLIDGTDGNATMQFDVCWEHKDIPLPIDKPSLQAFRKAFSLAHRPDAIEQKTGLLWTIPLESIRPVKRLGTLALVRYIDPHAATQTELEPDPIHGPCQHVAWMREPHFVVRYDLHRPALAMQWAGVFVAHPDLDKIFAQAEPPTHDAWNAQQLPSRSPERTFVTQAIRRIRETVDLFLVPSTGLVNQAGSVQPLGAFADSLGALIPAVPGNGAATRPTPPVSPSPSTPGASRGRRPQVRILEQGLVLEQGSPALRLKFLIESSSADATVTARADVLLEDGSAEGEQPSGADRPQVLRWNVGNRTCTGAWEYPEPLPPGEEGVVVISCPDDTRVRVTLQAEEAA